MSREIIYKNEFVSNFKLGNFATGSYMQTCCECGKGFAGDKLATVCLKCTIEHFNGLQCNTVDCCGIEFEKLDQDTGIIKT